MKLEDVIKILENHQKWRRGDDSVPMTDPKELGESLDVTLELLRRVSNIPKDDKILDKHESLESASSDKFSKEHRAGFWRGARWMRAFITETSADVKPSDLYFSNQNDKNLFPDLKELHELESKIFHDGHEQFQYHKILVGEDNIKESSKDFAEEVDKVILENLPKDDMENELEYIDYKGYRYWYEFKLAKDRVDICLATKDPKKYCNGFYKYSSKDPGSGKCFVVVKHNNPSENWMEN